jgi:hypothetical protein
LGISSRIWLWAVLSALLVTGCDKAPPERLVEIPDAGFLYGLIEAGVDANNDGLISCREAESTASIVLPPLGITDLTGIEAFINLDSLSIILNPLKELDLSENRALRYLECTSCELTALELSENPHLEHLICGRNLIMQLDLSQNRALVSLVCNNNLLSRLDLTINTPLTTLISCGNRLTGIDLSNNTSLVKIGIDNMPMLTEVCVWTLPFPVQGVELLMGYSPNIVFTNQCSNP